MSRERAIRRNARRWQRQLAASGALGLGVSGLAAFAPGAHGAAAGPIPSASTTTSSGGRWREHRTPATDVPTGTTTRLRSLLGPASEALANALAPRTATSCNFVGPIANQDNGSCFTINGAGLQVSFFQEEAWWGGNAASTDYCGQAWIFEGNTPSNNAPPAQPSLSSHTYAVGPVQCASTSAPLNGTPNSSWLGVNFNWTDNLPPKTTFPTDTQMCGEWKIGKSPMTSGAHTSQWECNEIKP